MIFRDRKEAGRYLATRLTEYAGRSDVVVLALPRGGVPVAFEVAMALSVPLDIFLVRKLGVPGHEELAMGAIASGGVRVLNEDVVSMIRVPEETIAAVAADEQRELERREKLYRQSDEVVIVTDNAIILIDDGLATGATMRAAAVALRRQSVNELIVAVPVAAATSCKEIETEVDRIVCAKTPEPFYGVGQWYEDFAQTTDEEVIQLLQRARQR